MRPTDVKEYMPFHLGCTIRRHFDGNPIDTVLTPENLGGFLIGWEPRWHKLQLKSLHKMTDQQAIHIAELALGGGNTPHMKNPKVFLWLEDITPIIWVVDNPEGRPTTWNEACKFGNDAIEIDSSFTVREKYNTFCEMPEIVKYLCRNEFDVFNLIPNNLAEEKES